MIKFRDLLPQSLFGRTLIIIIIPLIILQGVITYIFFERHWEDVGRRLVLALGGQITDITQQMKYFKNEPSKINGIFIRSERNYLMKITWDPKKRIELINQHSLSSVLDFTLQKSLSERLENDFKYDTRSVPKKVYVYVKYQEGVLTISVPKKTLYSSTTLVFMGWMIGTSLILLLLSIYFLGRQIVPLKKIALAAEAFGKGDHYHQLKPRGANELRMLAKTFLEMKERIGSQIKQRTEMLAGIGHDLRTPLTRMKLQIVLLKDKNAAASLTRDVDEMRDMVDAYLNFTKGEGEESIEPTNISSLIKDIHSRSKINVNNITLNIKVQNDLFIKIRPISIRRAIINLISNACNYSNKKILISLYKHQKYCIIMVEDDGVGVPKENFKAFYRIDSSRPSSSGNVGLGLTISRDIIRSHGGEITLDKSTLGGLKVTTKIPL